MPTIIYFCPVRTAVDYSSYLPLFWLFLLMRKSECCMRRFSSRKKKLHWSLFDIPAQFHILKIIIETTIKYYIFDRFLPPESVNTVFFLPSKSCYPTTFQTCPVSKLACSKKYCTWTAFLPPTMSDLFYRYHFLFYTNRKINETGLCCLINIYRWPIHTPTGTNSKKRVLAALKPLPSFQIIRMSTVKVNCKHLLILQVNKQDHWMHLQVF